MRVLIEHWMIPHRISQVSSPVPSTSPSMNRAPRCFLVIWSSRSSYCWLHLHLLQTVSPFPIPP
jgi:hypothetical protein